MKADIHRMSDLLAFRNDVRKAIIDLLAIPPSEQEEVLLILTELGTNLINHAGEGTLEVFLPDDSRPNLGIRAASKKAPQAAGTSNSFRPSLGFGLPSTRDLMDHVEILENEHVFEVICEKKISS